MPEKKSEDGRKEYVLRANMEHYGIDENGEAHVYSGSQKDNNHVFLTDVQFKAFADKFESVEDMETRVAAQQEANEANRKLQEITAALQEKGISIDDLLKGQAETLKRPDPKPGELEDPKEPLTPPAADPGNPGNPEPAPLKPAIKAAGSK